MRLRYIVAAVLSVCLLALSACDSGSGDSNIPFFPLSLIRSIRHDKPIRVIVGDYRAAIPANCFAPFSKPEGKRERAYIVSSDVLLDFLMPALACRTSQNRKDFSAVGLYRPGLAIFATKIGCSSVPSVVLPSLLQLEYKYYPYLDKLQFSIIKDGIDERVYAAKVYSIYREASRTLYVSKHDLSYTSCTRFGKPKKRGARQLISSCTLHMFRGRLLLQVNYAGGHEDRHVQIKEAVLRKLDEFARSAQQSPI